MMGMAVQNLVSAGKTILKHGPQRETCAPAPACCWVAMAQAAGHRHAPSAHPPDTEGPRTRQTGEKQETWWCFTWVFPSVCSTCGATSRALTLPGHSLRCTRVTAWQVRPLGKLCCTCPVWDGPRPKSYAWNLHDVPKLGHQPMTPCYSWDAWFYTSEIKDFIKDTQILTENSKNHCKETSKRSFQITCWSARRFWDNIFCILTC